MKQVSTIVCKGCNKTVTVRIEMVTNAATHNRLTAGQSDHAMRCIEDRIHAALEDDFYARDIRFKR